MALTYWKYYWVKPCYVQKFCATLNDLEIGLRYFEPSGDGHVYVIVSR